MVGIIIAVVLTLSAAGGGTAYASQGSLPGDTLYPVKLATEQARMALPGDDAAKAEWALTFAQRRVEEMEALAERERAQHLDLAAGAYDDAMDRVQARIARAAERGLVTGNVTALVAEATAKHMSVLDKVYDMVPDQAKPAIAHARDVSQTGHLRALDTLTQDDPVTATEINLAAIESRLNRAANAAQAQNAGEVADALGRFEEMSQFGGHIVAHSRQLGASEPAIVGELVAGATFRHLSVLDDVADKAPGGEALQAVVRARYESLSRYREGLMALSELDPAKATAINLRTMEERLNRISAAPDSTDAVENSLEQFDAMAEFGEVISRIAREVGSDLDKIDELIAEATFAHIVVLADIWERAPEQASEAIEIVMARVFIRHENRIHAMEQRGVEHPGHPDIPPHVRERVEERIRQQRIWDEREAALSPGTPGGVSGCPGCRRP